VGLEIQQYQIVIPSRDFAMKDDRMLVGTELRVRVVSIECREASERSSRTLGQIDV
jgi:hypothetical protein